MRLRILVVVSLLVPMCLAAERFQQAEPVRLTPEGEKWAEKTLRKLSLEEKIGQMFMLSAPTEFFNLENPDYLKLRDTIRRYHIGGLLLTVPEDGPLLYRNQPYEAAMFTNQLQADSDLPLIFAADFERGLYMRFYGTTGFPHSMAFVATGRPAYAEAYAQVVAAEARAIGVHWNFYPVADVNSNPANPIINTRAFGEDPQQVIEFVTTYIRSARAHGMMTTAKHFPGHGDADTNTHWEAARITGDIRRLESVELPPFRYAIAAGVDAVMVSHVTVPALDPTPKTVASTSSKIIGDVLKKQLGFEGLVVPDAMDMNAFTELFSGASPGRAAVEAIKAGDDMILMPADLDAYYNALLAAVRSGEIPEVRIDASVRKVLRAKASVGLDKARYVDPNQLPNIVARPQSLALAQHIADDAVTLVRDNGKVLPLARAGTSPPAGPYQRVRIGNKLLAILFTDDMRAESGRVLEHELRLRVPDARIIYVDPRVAAAITDEALDAVEEAQKVVVAVYSVPTSWQSSMALADPVSSLLRQILQGAAAKTMVVALGSPYLGGGYPQIENYLCTFSNAPVSEASAVKALFGEITIGGRLPVTVPNFAARGSGLNRPAALAGANPPPEGASHVEPQNHASQPH